MSKRDQILHVASNHLRQFGYSGFSYADIAKEIGITKASLHYHFATKEDLAIAICDTIQMTWHNVFQQLTLDSNLTAYQKLNAFIIENLSTLTEHDICPLLALLSDFASLPDALQQRLRLLIDYEYSLYRSFLQLALDQHEIRLTVDLDQCTSQIISMVKGALMYRRVSQVPQAAFSDIPALLLQLFTLWK